MRRFIASLLVASFTSFGCLVSQAWAAEYKIDPDHSLVGFKVKHLAISNVLGRFTKFEGKFSFDPKDFSSGSAEATIFVDSISTENKKRDDHLRSPDFFDAAKFSEISFKTSKVEATGKDSFLAKGMLTIHGITKPVVLNVNYAGTAKDPWGNERAAFSATTKINRKEFGLTWNKILETGGLVVGDDVLIDIEVEGIKQAAS